jgi:hypothetical protein
MVSSNINTMSVRVFADIVASTEVTLGDFRTNCFLQCASMPSCGAVVIGTESSTYSCIGLSGIAGPSSSSATSETWQMSMKHDLIDCVL